MVTGEAINIPGDVFGVPAELVLELGRIGKWIQAVGLIVIIWVIFQMVHFYFDRKRRKMIAQIKIDVERIERKIDKIGKGK